MSELLPGRYKGRIAGCDSGAVGENKTPLAKLFFKLEEGGKVLPWTGWFSDKVNQKTGKTYTELVIEKLLACGFTGKCVSEMSNPKLDINAMFNTEKVWDLDIDFQEDKHGVKTKYFEVNWINDPDKSASSKLDHAQAVQVFKGMNLGGEIARIRKGMPVDAKKVKDVQDQQMQEQQTFTPAQDSNFTADDIPF